MSDRLKLNFNHDGSLKPLLYGLKDTTTRKVDEEIIQMIIEKEVELWWELGTEYGIKLYDAKIVNNFPCSFAKGGQQYNLLTGKKLSSVEETRLAHHEAFSTHDNYIQALKDIYGDDLYKAAYMVMSFRHQEEIQDARVRVVRKLQQRDALSEAQQRIVDYMEDKIWD